MSTVRIGVDLSEWTAAAARIQEAMRPVVVGFADLRRRWEATSTAITWWDEFHVFSAPEPEPLSCVEPGPVDFEPEWTPASSMPHEPPPLVMPERAEPDWQALADRFTSWAGGSSRRRDAFTIHARRRGHVR